MELNKIRRNYKLDSLNRSSLNDNPVAQFEKWMEAAIDAQLPDPTAMSIATVSHTGQPSQRVVLLKNFNENGFVFFTNLTSRKSQEIANNAKVSLHFSWLELERQVSILGTAEALSSKDVNSYFNSRPRESQLGAWASKQSQPLTSRQAMLDRFDDIKQRFSEKTVDLPHFWGGFRVRAHEYEFWQGGENRLHDRFIYRHISDSNAWQIERLYP